MTGEKNRDYMSIRTELNTMRTTVIPRRTHLTTFVILNLLFLVDGILVEAIILLSKELSIGFSDFPTFS